MSTLIIPAIVIGIVANLFLSHLVGKNGENRQIGYGTSFFVSFFFSPLIGLLLVLTSKELTDNNTEIQKFDDGITTSLNEDGYNGLRSVMLIMFIIGLLLVLYYV